MPVFKGRTEKEGIGFVFQSIAIISIMSAYENVEFGLRVAGYSTAERKKAEECLKLVGLGKTHHRAHELSAENSKGWPSKGNSPQAGSCLCR